MAKTYLKLCGKKVLWTAFSLISWLLIVFVEIQLLKLIANPLYEAISGLGPVWRSIILFGIPLIFVFYMICHLRFTDKELRRLYLKTNGSEFCFSKECKLMAKSPDFRAELLLFMVLHALFLILMGTGVIGGGFEAPPYAVVLSGILVFFIFTAVYLVFSFSVWTVIHKGWLRESAKRKVQAS